MEDIKVTLIRLPYEGPRNEYDEIDESILDICFFIQKFIKNVSVSFTVSAYIYTVIVQKHMSAGEESLIRLIGTGVMFNGVHIQEEVLLRDNEAIVKFKQI